MKHCYEPDGEDTGGRREVYDYVIITDPALGGAVAASDFPDWKSTLGHSIRVVLTTDPEVTGQPGRDLAEKIRNFLRAYYPVWGIEYVLIVGNIYTVPMRYCFPNPDDPMHPGWSVPTDHYYADLSLPDNDSWDSDLDGFYGEYLEDTPDFLAEVSVGRIPTSSGFRVTYTLNKLVRFEQDTGSWKNNVLHGGAIMHYENQDHDGLPFWEGPSCLDVIETDFMTGWEIDHYSEQEGLVPSSYPWLPLNQADFTSTWRNNQYGIVTWAAHGRADGGYRYVWTWDDGDSVAERYGSDGFEVIPFISTEADLDDAYPAIVFAFGCNIGYPEPNYLGNLGVDLLTRPSRGASAGIVNATRPSAYALYWPSYLGGDASLCYEFYRFLLDGPAGPERMGDALYDSKYFVHLNHAFETWYEYLNMHGLVLYGDPAMERAGVATTVEAAGGNGYPRPRSLIRICPNPSTMAARIEYALPADMWVKLEILDVLGRRVTTLVDEHQTVGLRHVIWDASGRAAGIYFCRLTAGDAVLTERAVLLR